ncbi:DUF6147 family protein [Lederbergia panacisoli]|uniref:DUF6147 family protein n=1 Tax=Lederbergia panacisoli TaxID=1255251 RepID=UPI00214C6A23|nr:DUF6147 family protein [Lederbergia panacisoli]MCR2823738.1 DUF6147 family protein [Lederbergia panacisoli]
MNLLKRSGLLLAAVVFITLIMAVGESSADEIPMPVGTGSTQDQNTIQASKYFMSGNTFIQMISSTQVRVTGNTKAYRPVDNIKIDMTLQRWDSASGQWVDVLSLGSATNYSSSIVSLSKEAKVLKKSYYRVWGVHRVMHGGVVEQNTSISTYVFVD